MRLFRTRLHTYVALVFLACLVIAGIVMLLFPRGRVTRANFEKIQVGMSLEDVERLLGLPDFEARLVEGKDGDIRPEELRKEGDQDCILQVWASPEVNFIVIADPTRRVVRRDTVEMGLWDRVWYWVMEQF